MYDKIEYVVVVTRCHGKKRVHTIPVGKSMNLLDGESPIEERVVKSEAEAKRVKEDLEKKYGV